MPFRMFDPREHYAEHHVSCPPHVIVPTTDDVGWCENPVHRWVYDKLALAESQSILAGPHGVYPPQYPVVSKPIVNLDGGSTKARILNGPDEYLDCYEAGMMWMEFQEGPHLSIDIAVVEGCCEWFFAMEGVKNEGFGCFDMWRPVEIPEVTKRALDAWIHFRLRSYTGMANIEMIGDVITDFHLRDGDAGIFGGARYFDAVVELYENGEWCLGPDDVKAGVIAPVFARRQTPRPIDKINRATLSEFESEEGVIGIKVDEPDDRHANPPAYERLLIIQAWTEEKARDVRRRVQNHLPCSASDLLT